MVVAVVQNHPENHCIARHPTEQARAESVLPVDLRKPVVDPLTADHLTVVDSLRRL